MTRSLATCRRPNFNLPARAWFAIESIARAVKVGATWVVDYRQLVLCMLSVVLQP